MRGSGHGKRRESRDKEKRASREVEDRRGNVVS